MIEPKRMGRRSKKPTEAELAMYYSQMTAKECAEHYGVSEQTVRRWVTEYRKEAKRNGGKRM